MSNIEVRLNQSASRRIQNMEDALHEYQAGRISKHKFIGVCTTMCNFNRNATFWEADYDYVEQNRVYVAAAEFKDKSRGITPPISQRALIAKRLKMPEDSIIVGKVVSGEMTFDEAVPICDAIRHRHKNTAYDSLLALGVSKDDAREIIKTQKEMKTYSEFKTSLAESTQEKAKLDEMFGIPNVVAGMFMFAVRTAGVVHAYLSRNKKAIARLEWNAHIDSDEKDMINARHLSPTEQPADLVRQLHKRFVGAKIEFEVVQ